jgi:hypothetical protein
MGDAIVIWRTWVIWRSSIAMLIPVGLWLAALGKHLSLLLGFYRITTALSLALLITERAITVTVLDGLNSLASTESKLDISLFLAEYSLSVATNAVSTCMIGYKTW